MCLWKILYYSNELRIDCLKGEDWLFQIIRLLDVNEANVFEEIDKHFESDKKG